MSPVTVTPARTGACSRICGLASDAEGQSAAAGLSRKSRCSRRTSRDCRNGGVDLGDDAGAYAVVLTESLLGSKQPAEVTAGIKLAGEFRSPAHRDRLAALALGEDAPEPDRVEALATLAAIDRNAAVPLLSRALADPARPFAIRDRAATLLATTGSPEAQAGARTRCRRPPSGFKRRSRRAWRRARPGPWRCSTRWPRARRRPACSRRTASPGLSGTLVFPTSPTA